MKAEILNGQLRLTIPDEYWLGDGGEEDPILLGPPVQINGVSHHLNAIPVEIQHDGSLRGLTATAARVLDDVWQLYEYALETTPIRGRPHIIYLHPYGD